MGNLVYVPIAHQMKSTLIVSENLRMNRKEVERLENAHQCSIELYLRESRDELTAVYDYEHDERCFRHVALSEVAEALQEVFLAILNRRGLAVLDYKFEEDLGDLLIASSGLRADPALCRGNPRYLGAYGFRGPAFWVSGA